jgi:hypothetical protein
MENINTDEYFSGKVLAYLISLRNIQPNDLIINDISYDKYDNHIAIIIKLTNPNNTNYNKYCLFILDRINYNDTVNDNIPSLSTHQIRDFIYQLRNYSICPLPGSLYILSNYLSSYF